jgi:hypothetical protein
VGRQGDRATLHQRVHLRSLDISRTDLAFSAPYALASCTMAEEHRMEATAPLAGLDGGVAGAEEAIAAGMQPLAEANFAPAAEDPPPAPMGPRHHSTHFSVRGQEPDVQGAESMAPGNQAAGRSSQPGPSGPSPYAPPPTAPTAARTPTEPMPAGERSPDAVRELLEAGVARALVSLSLGITAVWTQTPPAQRPYGASCHRNPENRHARQAREQQT